MLISELVDTLTTVLKTYGDKPVVAYVDDVSGGTPPLSGPVVRILTVFEGSKDAVLMLECRS